MLLIKLSWSHFRDSVINPRPGELVDIMPHSYEAPIANTVFAAIPNEFVLLILKTFLFRLSN